MKLLHPPIKLFVFLLIVLGALIRLWYFLEPFAYSVNITPDESVYGLQALHILKGDFSIFYWAQPYTGTFSAFLSASLFFFFGPSAWSLKAVPYLFSVGFLALTYLLARKVFKDESTPLLALAFAALGTPFWNNWASRAGTGYPEATMLGELMLILALGALYRASNWTLRPFFLIGFLAGLGFWIQPTIIYYLAPILLFFFLYDRRFFVKRYFLGVVGGFVLGDLPVIFINLTGNSSTAGSLFHFSIRGLKRAVAGLLTEGMPVILGIRTSFSHTDFFTPFALIITLFFFGSVVLVLTRRFGPLLNSLSEFKQHSRPIDLILALFFFTLLIFLLTERFNQFVIEPRYILALYSTIPLILAYSLRQLWKKSPWFFGLISVVFLANFGFGIIKAPPKTFVDGYKLDKALEALDRRGITMVNSDGALAHRLMFLTQEKIIASVREGGLMAARRGEYNQTVLDSPWEHKGYLFLKTNSDLNIMENEIRSFVPTYRREMLEDQFVFLYPVWP
ncbi:MAG: glycosyltransferase family 39 protein [Patescibacteria group bacterium]